ncbi:hypothetical protein IQ230_25390 [Gloeocapsopsis crepidinum LEGE 06123]|uniref:Transposase n=1 Tax=Gloeocapsopsis crepidinum LEGE 06123 TaxID=588587 RepID=A0ABR9V012_9CHRO|nr:hypothetical protein [Gloeocapsopsis crepidinum]MBE9193595.1 hypothetical protein [Gloeocapsopsis crepidinum LEGE 06123]
MTKEARATGLTIHRASRIKYSSLFGVNDKLHATDKGLVKLVIWQLNSYHGQGQERIANLSGYLKRFSNAVHYEKFRAQGLPIGSGEVESAHRYIPQKRLKIPGTTWHPDTVNPMLALRIFGLMIGGRISGRNNQLPTRTLFYEKPFRVVCPTCVTA